jgi:hypothetical protein
MIYNFDDINVGDEVYFESTHSQSNYDLYWKVIEKLDQSKELIIRLNEMGYKDIKWIIKIKEVKYHIPIKSTKR